MTCVSGLVFDGTYPRGTRPDVDQLAFFLGLAGTLTCRRRRAGHREITTRYQRDSGGRCFGTVRVTKHANSTS